MQSYGDEERLKKLWEALDIPSDSRAFARDLLAELFNEQFLFLRESIRLVQAAIEGRKRVMQGATQQVQERLHSITVALGQLPRGVAYAHIEARRAHLEREIRAWTEGLMEEHRRAVMDLFYLYRRLLDLLYSYRLHLAVRPSLEV